MDYDRLSVRIISLHGLDEFDDEIKNKFLSA